MATDQDARTHLTDLVGDARVALLTTMTPEGRHVSRPTAVQEAELDGDRWYFAEELCTPVLEAWSPEGPQTPGTVLVEVEADTAEHREGPSRTAGSALGSLRAVVTRDPGEDPGTDETVQL